MKSFFTFMFAERGDKIVAAAATSAAAVAASASSAGAGAASPPVSKEKLDKAAAAQQALNQAFASFGVEFDPKMEQIPFPLPPLKSDEDRQHDLDAAADYLDAYEHALGFALADVRTHEIKIPLTKPAGVGEESKRYEWFQFQYDTVYNPHAVYHMEIKWFETRAAAIPVPHRVGAGVDE